MKRILFIAPIETKDRFKGGITSYAESIISNKDLFENAGIDFVPFNNCLVNRKAGTNGKFSFLNTVNFIKTRHLISKKIKRDNYDAIYLNTSFGISLLKDLLTLKKRYRKHSQVFLHIHFAGFDNVFTKNNVVKKLILKSLKNKVTNIISLSHIFKNELIANGFAESKIQVLYNYFNPSLPKSDLEQITKRLSKRDNKTVFLFVGSLDKRKGFYDLINVFKNFSPNQAKLIICGNPNDAQSQAIIDEIHGNPLFEYRGYVSGNQKIEAFIDSDVLVLPSYGEGLPITILEAYNFGLPIISTNVGAIPEIVTDGLGVLSEPGELAKLQDNMRLFFDKNVILKMSSNALEASNLYTFKEFSKNLIKIIID